MLAIHLSAKVQTIYRMQKNNEMLFAGLSYVQELAKKQTELYRVQPAEVASHYNREQRALDSYRGRQLLELLQNADDACENFEDEKKLLFRLTKDYFIIANTGHPFTKQGIESLVISDNSPKQLKRTRYIGNKGLGFRSVLSWSPAPIVLSGDFLIAFADTHAKETIRRLAAEIDDLRDLLERWDEAGRGCPASILRFPYVPDINNVQVHAALDVLKEGYNTVIILPLPQPPRQNEIYAEINAQLQSISGEIAIFCYHLEKIIVQADTDRSWELVRERQNDRQSLFIHDGNGDHLWTVYRRESHLPDNLLSHELRRTPEFEMAIAVPEGVLGRTNHKLCVYFPTDETLPIPLLCHASLDTDDSRNRLIKHEANKYVLRALGKFIVEIAEQEATTENPWLGLDLLAGIENCDPELVEMGLRDAVIEECKKSNIFYRLDGSFATADKVYYSPNSIWYEIVTADYFPEILRLPESKSAQDFLRALEIPWYESEDVSQRIELFIKSVSSHEAGVHVGKLMLNKQIPRNPLPALLIGSSGNVLPSSQTAFLPSETESADLPTWVESFSLLDRAFVDSVRSEAKVQLIRDLRNQFV
ncbi:MAG: hypothetical protein HQL08_14300, partial [Nitrospirae bacterium]|nr:hypothetical protein [Nitrospirota bacterium]